MAAAGLDSGSGFASFGPRAAILMFGGDQLRDKPLTPADVTFYCVSYPRRAAIS